MWAPDRSNSFCNGLRPICATVHTRQAELSPPAFDIGKAKLKSVDAPGARHAAFVVMGADPL